MLIGLPASGKSTFAGELLEGRDDIVYISSDKLREEMYGDESIQKDNGKIFEEMAVRTRNALKKGQHVIYDATNISRKKRIGLLKQLPYKVKKTAVYMATSHKTSYTQNLKRERQVPAEVIDNMYKTLQIPIESEGWDNVVVFHEDDTVNNEYPKQFSDAVKAGVLLNREGYDLMNFLAVYFKPFFNISDLAQDSKWHSLSVSRHTYYVYKHVLDTYKAKDDKEMELMLWTALLHDTGKHFAKSFRNYKGEETRYANFIGHEFVSSQLAVPLLKQLGYDDEFIHTVATLIQFHMYLLNADANKEKLLKHVGEDLYKKLEFLREADTLAH